MFLGGDNLDSNVILVTSATSGEGKTSTVYHLGIVAAQTGRNVLVVDANLRRPQLHQMFYIENDIGLSGIVGGEKWSECIIKSETPRLYLMPSGPAHENPNMILYSREFTNFLEHCCRQFDLVIIDSPPVLEVSDAIILAPSVGGIVFVIDGKRTSRASARRAISALRHVNGRIIGGVLNRKPKGQYDYHIETLGELQPIERRS